MWWKSRWSRPRLVNTATAKRVASTRCMARACDDTSIETARRPSSRNAASRSWSSGASGVVWDPESVPMTPVGQPAASSTAASRWVTVVLPFVPVTPTTARLAEGSPKNAAASGAIATRVSSTITWATSRPSDRSTSSAVAPLATAAAAKSCPSTRSPRRQQNSVPGPTRRESWVIAAGATACSPRRPMTRRPCAPASATSASSVLPAGPLIVRPAPGSRRRPWEAARRTGAARPAQPGRTAAPPPGRRSGCPGARRSTRAR